VEMGLNDDNIIFDLKLKRKYC